MFSKGVWQINLKNNHNDFVFWKPLTQSRPKVKRSKFYKVDGFRISPMDWTILTFIKKFFKRNNNRRLLTKEKNYQRYIEKYKTALN
jgi:hypothetical protein